MTTIEQALSRLKELAHKGATDRLAEIQADLTQATNTLAAARPDNIPDVSGVLASLAGRSKEVTALGSEAEAGTGQLSGVFARLGLLDQELFEPVGRPPEPVEVPTIPTRRFLVDTQTRAVIEGTLRGRLPKGHAMTMVQALGERQEPTPQRDLAKAVLGRAGDANLRSMRGKISELNRAMEKEGLPPVIERGEPTGYILSPTYRLLNQDIFNVAGEEPAQPPSEEVLRPMTYRIGEVSEELEMSVTRIRNLGYQLMESGHMLVGEHVMERHEGGKHYIDYTDTGKVLLRRIRTHFEDYSHIPVDSVRSWLDEEAPQRGGAKTEGSPLYYGSQVAEAAGIPPAALDIMQEIGVLREGTHFVRKGARNIRVYTQEALPLAVRVKARADKEGQDYVTKRLVRDEFRIWERPTENPFGPNGPKTVDDQVELFLLQTTLTCLPAMERRGIAIGKEQEERLKSRVAELTEHVGYVDSEQVGAVRTLAAATAFDLTRNQRPFNFLQKTHPGLRVVKGVIDALKASDPNLLVEFPNAVKEPPKPVPIQGPQGEVNGSILVGWMGDRR